MKTVTVTIVNIFNSIIESVCSSCSDLPHQTEM